MEGGFGEPVLRVDRGHGDHADPDDVFNLHESRLPWTCDVGGWTSWDLFDFSRGAAARPPSAARRVATGAGGRIGPMIAEPTYEQMQALAIKLTQKLCKRVAAGDEDLSEEEAFIVTVVELYDRLGTADEVALSRQHFVILRELANKMMLQTAADVLAAKQAPDTLH